jgi:hypothetical protein
MMLLDLYPRNPKRFLSPPSSISYEDENESNEPYYNEDKDQLEEEQEGNNIGSNNKPYFLKREFDYLLVVFHLSIMLIIHLHLIMQELSLILDLAMTKCGRIIK